jgi:catechol 2,3-dioxygenase-like lactoylglutathione lyase family enzyme
MQFEHLALNVPDPAGFARWYVTHLAMSVVRRVPGEPDAHFLADATGRVVLEVYRNPLAPLPDYASQHHLVLHVAFAVDDAEAVKVKLLDAGATLVEQLTPDDGSRIVMLRDPWGVALQLCQRARPMVG